MDAIYQFRSLNALVGVDSTLASHLDTIIGWPRRLVKGKPTITAVADGDRYLVNSPMVKNGPLVRVSKTSAACEVVALIGNHAADEQKNIPWLHSGAVLIEDKLTVLLGTYRAGKSLLTAHFAAFGFKVFTDDVIPIVKGQGMALGIQPRLRLPLPVVSDYFRKFVERETSVSDRRYAYLKHPKAYFGDKADIGRFVIIERGPPGISRTDARKDLGLRNFAKGNIKKEMERLAQIPAYRLSYEDPVDAIKLIGAPLWRIPGGNL